MGGFRKINMFWGYEDFVDIFWGSSQNWAIFLFLSGGIFGLLKFQIFFGVLEIPDIFGGEG